MVPTPSFLHIAEKIFRRLTKLKGGDTKRTGSIKNRCVYDKETKRTGAIKFFQKWTEVSTEYHAVKMCAITC